MAPFIITVIALWTYPFLALFAARLISNKCQPRKTAVLITTIITLITLIGLVFNVSTTFQLIDWIILTSIYFSLCLTLWLAFYSGKKIIKALSILIMYVIFGFGYLSSTIGILGIGMTMGEFVPALEKNISKDLIYKETNLGSAISDYRGKKVEIYKTISWLPVIEWRIIHKNYFNSLIFSNQIKVHYHPGTNMIYLNVTEMNGKELETWADTLKLN